MAAAELLKRAADLIEQSDGLARETYHDTHSDCYCTVGAIAKALNPDDLNLSFGLDNIEPLYGALSYLDDALGFDGDVNEGRITDWNDEPARSAVEVVDALRAAAKLAETVPGS